VTLSLYLPPSASGFDWTFDGLNKVIVLNYVRGDLYRVCPETVVQVTVDRICGHRLLTNHALRSALGVISLSLLARQRCL